MSQKLRQKHSSSKTDVITRVSCSRFYRVEILRRSNGGRGQISPKCKAMLIRWRPFKGHIKLIILFRFQEVDLRCPRLNSVHQKFETFQKYFHCSRAVGAASNQLEKPSESKK